MLRLLAFSLVSFALGCSGGGGGSGLVDGLQPSCFLNFDIDFYDVSSAELNRTYESNEVIAPKLCDSPHIVDILGGEYSINGGPWSRGISEFRSRDRLRVRTTSAATLGTTVSTTVSIAESRSGLYKIFASNGTFKITTKPGDVADAPLASISSPSNQDIVDALFLTVTGTSTDDDTIQEVLVNGVAANSVNSYATWTATIRLATGSNTITVATTDELLNHNPKAAEIVIDNIAIVLRNPDAITSDRQNEKLLVVDSGWNALIEVDFATGVHAILSDENAGIAFSEPVSIAYSAQRGLAWVIDSHYQELIEINLVDGSRKPLMSAANPLRDSRQVVVDEVRDQLLLLRSSYNTNEDDTQIYAVDLVSGNQRLLSDNETPDHTNPFGSMSAIVFDEPSDQLLVLRGNGNETLAVDPVTGSRLPIGGGFSRPVSAVADSFLSRILVADSYTEDVRSYDPVTSETQQIGRVPRSVPEQIALDQINNRVVVQRKYLDDLGAIDLNTGEFSVVY